MGELDAIDYERLRDLVQQHAELFPGSVEDVRELEAASRWETMERQWMLVCDVRNDLEAVLKQPQPSPVLLLGYLRVLSILGDQQSVVRIRERLTGVREREDLPVQEPSVVSRTA